MKEQFLLLKQVGEVSQALMAETNDKALLIRDKVPKFAYSNDEQKKLEILTKEWQLVTRFHYKNWVLDL